MIQPNILTLDLFKTVEKYAKIERAEAGLWQGS